MRALTLEAIPVLRVGLERGTKDVGGPAGRHRVPHLLPRPRRRAVPSREEARTSTRTGTVIPDWNRKVSREKKETGDALKVYLAPPLAAGLMKEMIGASPTSRIVSRDRWRRPPAPPPRR